MSYTFVDRNEKVVLHSWGRFRATMFEAVVTGDLVALKSATGTSLQLGDDSDGQGAIAVACENIAASATGWCALATELKAPVSVGTGGAVTQTYFDDGTDVDIGQDLYLGESGKCDSTIGGTTKQRVGYNIARDRILLVPGGSITGAAGSFTTLAASGATALSTTLAVTGAVTLALVTDATNSTSGAIKTAGGMGIAKKLYVGTDLDVAGNATIDGTLTQTGVATFAAQDVHTLGLTVATTKPLIQGTCNLPKLIATAKTSGSGAWTITAAELIGGFIIDATTTGGSAPTMPTVADVVAALPGYIAGTTIRLVFKNTGDQTATLTTDASAQWTMEGIVTIITKETREFLCRIESATAGTVYAIGHSTTTT